MRTNDQFLLEQAYTKILERQFGIANPTKGETQSRITKNELVRKIIEHEQAHPGTSFLSLTQITLERTKVVPQGIRFILPGLKNGETNFAKVSQLGCRIGLDYGAEENRAREKIGLSTDFVPQASIYTKAEGSKAVESLDGQLYLYYRPGKLSKDFPPVIVKAVNPNPSTPNDFEIVSREYVNQFKSPPRPSNRMTTVRKVSIDGIAAIKISGQNYIITDLDPIRRAIYEAAGAPMPVDVIENEVTPEINTEE